MGRRKKSKRKLQQDIANTSFNSGNKILDDSNAKCTLSPEVHPPHKKLKTASPASSVGNIVSPSPSITPIFSHKRKIMAVAVTRIDLTDLLLSPMPDVFERYDCIDAMPLLSDEAQSVVNSQPKKTHEGTELIHEPPEVDADDEKKEKALKLDGTIPLDCNPWRIYGRCKKHKKNKCRYRHIASMRGAERKHFVQVIKTPSANTLAAQGKKKSGKKRRQSYDNSTAPNGDCGDGIPNPDPVHTPNKYWAQRRRLFSKFDEGIQLDPESWYSVTPEAIADHVAHRVFAWRNILGGNNGKFVLLDAFGGCGGNTIAFSKKWPGDGCFGDRLIVCVDIDRQKLRMAAHNAKIYGVDSRSVVFIHGDALCILKLYEHGLRKNVITIRSDIKETDKPTMEICNGYRIGGLEQLPDHVDLTFLSSPWGGVGYGTVGQNGFHLKDILLREDGRKDVCGAPPVSTDGVGLLKMAAQATHDAAVIYFLPRNINLISLGAAAAECVYSECGVIEVEENWLKGKLKTTTAYMCSKDAWK